MFKSKIILVAAIGLIFASFVFATTLERGISAAIEKENNPQFEELYRLKIENKTDGLIAVSQDEGGSWETIGKVLYPTEKVNKNGYSASKWMDNSRVVAVAVNAIHIKLEPTEESRTIFSILPKEFLMPPKKYRSYISPNSSIYTNLSSGTGIFGGGFAPFVGNQVYYSQDGTRAFPLPPDYEPKVGDTLFILVTRPTELPQAMVFENRFGGQITLKYESGGERIIGEVLRPVVGVGRFEGSLYVGPGRIRANHAGVIDISVSPKGRLGGFQIVPALHGSEMNYVKKMTQWMVIGPARVDDPSIEGMAPFYKYFIQPRYRADDLDGENWQQKLLARYLVDVKFAGKDNWQPMPVYSLYRRWPLPSWAGGALDKISHIRILFPLKQDQPGR